MGPVGWGGLDWIGYLRPDQFLDHLTVIINTIKTRKVRKKDIQNNNHIPNTGITEIKKE